MYSLTGGLLNHDDTTVQGSVVNACQPSAMDDALIHQLNPDIWLLCLLIGLYVCQQEYSKMTCDFRETWMGVAWAKEEPVKFRGGSESTGEYKILFLSLLLQEKCIIWPWWIECSQV